MKHKAIRKRKLSMSDGYNMDEYNRKKESWGDSLIKKCKRANYSDGTINNKVSKLILNVGFTGRCQYDLYVSGLWPRQLKLICDFQ